MYGDALREVQYAQRVWGDSPQLQATSAWIRHQQGLTLTADERFAALRGAITTMRRAYPQFMAAGGEALPRRRAAHHLPARLLAAHHQVFRASTSSTRI